MIVLGRPGTFVYVAIIMECMPGASMGAFICSIDCSKMATEENPFLQLVTSEGARKRLRQLYEEETVLKGESDAPASDYSPKSPTGASSLPTEEVSRVLESTFLITARDSEFSAISIACFRLVNI